MMKAGFCPSSNQKRCPTAVGLWLMLVALVILVMVMVGGLTRLTGSGLSITEWQPIMGAIPPLSDAAWSDAFAKYKQIPQYQQLNSDMTLAGFKEIFWWEWTHRFLGRFLGLLFFLPFCWFAATGAITRKEWPRMLLLFALGGLQGLIGWWMVASGLETRVTVSQYRLAIHLGAAIFLLGAILWTALDYLRPGRKGWAPKLAIGFIGLIYFQILLGALVAGLHAGLIYNTWPDMNGSFLPQEAFFHSPWWRNFFENPALAQFDHRLTAYALAALTVAIYANALRQGPGKAKTSGKIATVAVTLQVFLGIVTLLFRAPLALSAMHQLLAALLFCAAIWHAHELRRPIT